MKLQPKFRNLALAATLAAVTATAWATNEALNATYVPNYSVAVEEPAPLVEPAPVAVNETATLEESLSANETVVTANEPVPVVVERRTIAQPAITVEERRLSRDERIQLQVMDRLAELPNLSGKIGVESRDAVVRLTGYTATSGQAYRAGREAARVLDVRYVENHIRPRVGGSV